MALDARVLPILCCPVDKGPLWYFPAEAVLYNPRLRTRYRVEDDVAQMMPEEASPTDEAEHARLMALAKGLGIGPNFLAGP
jgi:uncharacterized protein YbaR (Trm112 family)